MTSVANMKETTKKIYLSKNKKLLKEKIDNEPISLEKEKEPILNNKKSDRNE
jgi:hypothetical protein